MYISLSEKMRYDDYMRKSCYLYGCDKFSQIFELEILSHFLSFISEFNHHLFNLDCECINFIADVLVITIKATTILISENDEIE